MGQTEAKEHHDYEYEYHPTETETFLFDVDLSSLNGVIRTRNPGGRRNLDRPTKADDVNTPTQDGKPRQHSHDSQVDLDSRKDATAEPGADPSEATPGPTNESNNGISAVSKEIQILELDSRNPIISYGDQVYSCSWSDAIGTNLYFSEPSDLPKDVNHSSPGQYDFLGSSRIKLVGHRARVTQRSGTRKRGRPVNEQPEEADEAEVDLAEIGVDSGKSLGDLRFSSAKVNADIRRQARFLENLMNVKKAKGERDVVRTIVNPQMIAAMNRSRSRDNPTDQATLNEEVERLNRRIIRGDVSAVARLQQIYALDDVDVEALPKLPEGLSIPVPEPDAPSDPELQHDDAEG